MYRVDISNCYNIGNVFANSCNSCQYGSVIGHHTTGNLSNAYYADWIDCNWAYGYGSGTLGCTSFGKDEISGLPAKLGSTYFTNDTKGINNGYPILKWELEIED